MYFYVYYIKENLFKQKISIFINLAVVCKAMIFTCKITINNFTCVIISFYITKNISIIKMNITPVQMVQYHTASSMLEHLELKTNQNPI